MVEITAARGGRQVTLDHDMAVLAESRTLHRVGERGT